jgi:hypothetical protein
MPTPPASSIFSAQLLELDTQVECSLLLEQDLKSQVSLLDGTSIIRKSGFIDEGLI